MKNKCGGRDTVDGNLFCKNRHIPVLFEIHLPKNRPTKPPVNYFAAIIWW